MELLLVGHVHKKWADCGHLLFGKNWKNAIFLEIMFRIGKKIERMLKTGIEIQRILQL